MQLRGLWLLWAQVPDYIDRVQGTPWDGVTRAGLSGPRGAGAGLGAAFSSARAVPAPPLSGHRFRATSWGGRWPAGHQPQRKDKPVGGNWPGQADRSMDPERVGQVRSGQDKGGVRSFSLRPQRLPRSSEPASPGGCPPSVFQKQRAGERERIPTGHGVGC